MVVIQAGIVLSLFAVDNRAPGRCPRERVLGRAIVSILVILREGGGSTNLDQSHGKKLVDGPPQCAKADIRPR